MKGVDVLLRAFARTVASHPGAHLRICGEGPQRSELLAMVDRLGLRANVSFVFEMTMEWLRELGPAWALVTPSIHREPLGLVAIESIVHGVPVIATRGGGLEETVTDGETGLLVAPGDEDGLAAAMDEIASRRSFPGHSVRPKAGAAIARRHELDAHVRGVRELLGSMAGRAA